MGVSCGIPFVFDRQMGFFYLISGPHQLQMRKHPKVLQNCDKTKDLPCKNGILHVGSEIDVGVVR